MCVYVTCVYMYVEYVTVFHLVLKSVSATKSSGLLLRNTFSFSRCCSRQIYGAECEES